jgi:DNA-binding response OmpR family regulator
MSQRKQASRILLVSQQFEQTEKARGYLARGGYQTIISSYADAQRLLAERAPDAAIIQTDAANSESLSICHRLRLSAGSAFPILIITPDEKGVQPKRSIWHWADDYLLEPIDADSLLVRISVLLKRKQAQAAGTEPHSDLWLPATEPDEFLRLTEEVRTAMMAGKLGAIAMTGVEPITEAPAGQYAAFANLDDEQVIAQQRLALADLFRFLAARLDPALGGSHVLVPYGSFSLFAYQPNCSGAELAERLQAWRDEYRLHGRGELVAGIASFPEDASNMLDLISLADEALAQARRQRSIISYRATPQTTVGGHQPQLLIVDDSQEQVEMLDLLVSQEGYHALRAYNGEQALEVLSRQRPDLLLLDLVMPRLDGFAVMRHLRDRNGGRLYPPVIMITANDCEESVLHGFELGARDYIIKPYHPRELLSRINSALSNSGQ